MVKFINSTDNPSKIIEESFKVMKFIKPFSFHELFSLVKEVDKSGEIMDGKDIIMLLGTTGSGKSTTVHYLAGSKMRLVRVNGIPHYEPA